MIIMCDNSFITGGCTCPTKTIEGTTHYRDTYSVYECIIIITDESNYEKLGCIVHESN